MARARAIADDLAAVRDDARRALRAAERALTRDIADALPPDQLQELRDRLRAAVDLAASLTAGLDGRTRRRGRGEGTIRERPDGRWEARLTDPVPGNPHRLKSIYGKTRRDVAERLTEALAARRRGATLAGGPSQTLKHYLEVWLRDVAATSLAPGTYRQYRSALRTHVIPALGHRRLADLAPDDLIAYQQAKLDEGYGPSTIQNHRVALSSALADAVRRRLLVRNVVAEVRRPRVPRTRVAPVPRETVLRVLAAVRDSQIEAIVVLALFLGLRRAEILGLTWDDVDTKRRLLRVWDTLQHGPDGPVSGGTKTHHSGRLLAMPRRVVEVLEAERRRQADMRGQCQPGRWKETGYVFTDARGRPITPTRVSHRVKAAVELAGCPGTTLRQLRHGFASYLFAGGVDLRRVSEAMGHSSTNVTGNVYTHLVQALSFEDADRIDTLLAEGPDGQ